MILSHIETLFNQKDYGKVLTKLNQFFKNNPQGNPRAFYLRGMTFAKTGDFSEAANCFMLCLEMDENHQLASLEMGRVHYDMGHFEEALVYCEKCLKINKRNIQAHYIIAKVHQQENELDAAENKYIQCLKLYPGNQKITKQLQKLRKKIKKEKTRSEQFLQEVNKKIESLKQKQESSQLCVVCIQRKSNTAGKQCGHICLCWDCKVENNIMKCPICNKKKGFMKVFSS